MSTIFKTLSHVFIIFALTTLFSSKTMAAEASTWEQIRSLHFGLRPIHDNATELLFIEVPDKVEDAAIMPITIKSLAAQTPEHHIKTLHLIVDNNPQPYSAAFHLSPKLGAITISTRIRMDNFSNVRVIAEMNDNSLHMVKQFVVASGGCSSPASKDPTVSAARLGKIQLRMRGTSIGQTTTVQMIISHPNANGMQFNPQSNLFIPARYVTNIDISFNNETLINVDTGITISEDPSIRFNFIPNNPGILKVKVTDSKHVIYTSEKQIN